MKPDQYRIDFRAPNSLDLAWKAWSLTHSAFGHGMLAARALRCERTSRVGARQAGLNSVQWQYQHNQGRRTT